VIGAKLSHRYEIVREIGRGGMGVVYLARDPMLDREVAIKLLSPSAMTAEAQERFHREARIIAKMDHPGIVVVYDTGEYEGAMYLVMPYVRGTNLRALMQERSLRQYDIVCIGIAVAEALEYSHSQGVVHRDIKPENILVMREAENLRVRVTDFGLAVSSSDQRLTHSGMVVGTITYLSPEQVYSGEIDARTDLYALGTVLYECLTGETPFTGDLHSVLYRIVHENARTLSEFGAQIDEMLERMILPCLEKEKDKRPKSARELAEALTRCREHMRTTDREWTPGGASTTYRFEKPAVVPWIGRPAEFAELQRRLNEAASGECQFALVGGEPGIGKSRLLDELEKLSRARKFRVLHGRFVEQDKAFPYQGFCEIIQDHFRSGWTGTSGPVDFTDLAPDLTALFPALTEVHAVSSHPSDVLKPGAESARKLEDRTAIYELLARTLIRISAGKPLVILLEDLQSANVSLDALQYIVRRLGAAPILLAGTYHTTEVDKRHPLKRLIDSFEGDRRFALITLNPLPFEEHAEFLEKLIGSKNLDRNLVQKLYESTEGNPYFLRELVRSLLDSQRILPDRNGLYILVGDEGISSESLPTTIQQTVEKRIQFLPEHLREILSTASILGKTFELRDLEVILEDTDKLDDEIDHLIAAGFVEEVREVKPNRFSFSSGVVRDVLYAEVPRRKRKALHNKIAEALEKRNAGRLERVFPQLIHHYAAADVPEKVLEYGLQHATKSLEAFSTAEAIRSAKTVLDFTEEDTGSDPLVEAEARAVLGAAHRMEGNIEAALVEWERSLKIFERERQQERVASVLLSASETAWAGRKTEEATRLVERGLECARALEDKATLTRLLSLGAMVANLRGDYRAAREYMEESEALQPPPAAREQEQAPRGGRLVVPFAVPIHLAHPVQVTLDEEVEIASNLFEPLLSSDSRGNLVPVLCERWEVLEQGTIFRLTLRSNVRFTDGRLLTAGGVVRSFERSVRIQSDNVPEAIAAIKGASAFIEGTAEHIEGLTAVSENEVRIELTGPIPVFPALLTDVRTSIVCEGEDTCGTGPFKVSSSETNRVVLERNESYWKGTTSFLDSIEFRGGVHPTEIAAGFRNGEFDLVRDLLPDDLDDILRHRRFRAGVVETPKKNTYFVLLNSCRPVFQNPAVRNAITGVVRTHDLVHRALGRFAQPAEGLLPPGIAGHDPARRRRPLPPEKASEILTAALGPGPIKLRASVHPVFFDRCLPLTTALLEVWKDIGVEISTETPDLASFIDSLQNNEQMDLIIARWVADYDDPDSFAHVVFNSNVGIMRKYHSSQDLDKLIHDARTEGNPVLHERLYRMFESSLLETGFFLPLFHDIDYRIASPRVKQLRLHSSPPYVNYAEIGKGEPSAAPVRKKTGGAIHIPIAAGLSSLDPALMFTSSTSEIVPHIFESLIRERDLQMKPWLVSEPKIEEGGKRYRFRLRDNVRFHDGRPLSSRDVRYSFERLLQNQNSETRWLFSPIRGAAALLNGRVGDLEGFRILSRTEFSIDLEQPMSFFPALISLVSAAIVSEGSDQFAGTWKDGCVGTGPFRVVRFDPGNVLELEPSPYYWRPGLPKSDRLTFSFGVPPDEINSGFLEGHFSMAWELFPADVESLRRDPQFASQYREQPRPSTYYVAFNTQKGPLADRKTRELLIQSVDVENMVRRQVGPLAIPSHGLIPPGFIGYEPAGPGAGSQPAIGSGQQNIPLTAMLNSVYEGRYAPLAEDFFRILSEKGFKAQVLDTKSEYYSNQPMAMSSADLLLTRWIADFPDTDTFMYSLLHSEKGVLGRLCGTPEIDRLIERGRLETDRDVRHDIYREIESILVRDALLLPLFHEQSYCFIRPEVEGLEMNYFSPVISGEKLWVRR
jgi:ABC-type transport system substrate-binding protein